MLQTEFFDTQSRGGSFDYDAFLADIAKRPLPSIKKMSPRDDETQNPLYGQGRFLWLYLVSKYRLVRLALYSGTPNSLAPDMPHRFEMV